MALDGTQSDRSLTWYSQVLVTTMTSIVFGDQRIKEEIVVEKFSILPIWAGVLLLISLGTTACTIKATTDTTTDGTTEFLSSTTGKTWWTEDGLVKEGAHARAFVFVNYDNLLHDIAKGKGEYLFALGQILHVPSEHQENFANRLQRHYADLSLINARQDETLVTQFINEVVWVRENHSSPDI